MPCRCEALASEQRLDQAAQAAAEPVPDRQHESPFRRGEQLCRQQVGDRLPQQVLVVLVLESPRRRNRQAQLDELVIQERHPGLHRVGHREPVGHHQELFGELGAHVDQRRRVPPAGDAGGRPEHLLQHPCRVDALRQVIEECLLGRVAEIVERVVETGGPGSADESREAFSASTVRWPACRRSPGSTTARPRRVRDSGTCRSRRRARRRRFRSWRPSHPWT